MRTIPLFSAALAIALASCQPPPQPPSDPEPFFVGAWAADAGLCGDPWIITEAGLTTPGEVACTFNAITRTETGYEVQATCTAEAPPAPYVLRFAYAQSAQALLIEGGPFNPIGLTACP